MVQTSKSLKIHLISLFIPLTEPALFHLLAVWKEEGQSPSTEGLGAYLERKGPFEELIPERHPVMPKLSCCLLLYRQYCSQLETLLQGSQRKGTYMALPLELWSSGLNWRSVRDLGSLELSYRVKGTQEMC